MTKYYAHDMIHEDRNPSRVTCEKYVYLARDVEILIAERDNMEGLWRSAVRSAAERLERDRHKLAEVTKQRDELEASRSRWREELVALEVRIVEAEARSDHHVELYQQLRAQRDVLLAALKEAEEYVHLWMADNTGERELDALERIEAAIAKAEGR